MNALEFRPYYFLLQSLRSFYAVLILGGGVFAFHEQNILLKPLFYIVAVTLTLIISGAVLIRWRNKYLGQSWFLSEIVMILTGVYFVGGATNALISILLLPLAFSAMFLPRKAAITMACIAIAGYSILIRLNHPQMHQHHQMDNGHFLGMLFTFVVAALVLVITLSFLNNKLKATQSELMETREQQLRQEQIIGVGALAAHAAHDLGTPINSLILLAEEIEEGLACGESVEQDLDELKQVTQKCRNIVSNLSNQAKDNLSSIGDEVISLGELLKTVTQRLSLMHPNITADVNLDSDLQWLHLPASPIFLSALLNLHDNAAKASAKNKQTRISITLCKRSTNLEWLIQDFGNGIAEDILKTLGQQQISSETEGLGLGYFLANASLELYGAKVAIQNNSSGCLTSITIAAKGVADE